jgi:hypothetical protein
MCEVMSLDGEEATEENNPKFTQLRSSWERGERILKELMVLQSVYMQNGTVYQLY